MSQFYSQRYMLITLVAVLAITGCTGGASVHTTGDTIDIVNFKGVLSLNIDAASGDLKNNPILKSKTELDAVKVLNDRYKRIDSYAVLLPTATPEELKMTVHQALRGRGYTHLLIAAINPVQSHTTTSSHYDQVKKAEVTNSSTLYAMDISCTIYRLNDGQPISHVNADAYDRDKSFWERQVAQTIFSSENAEDRWTLGTIYSCDEALKAVIK